MINTTAARTTELAGQTNNPFVAWNNLAKGKTYGGTATLADGPAANAFSGTTYDYWLPDVTGTSAILSIDLGTATSLTFAALAAHNAGTLGATVAIQHSADNVSWASVDDEVPTNDAPIAFRFVAISRRYWRFTFNGLTAADPLAVGVAFLGNETIIPRRFYQGFSPVITSTEIALQSNVSVGGNLLGSTVVGTGSTFSATVNNVDATFIRGTAFVDFMTQFGRGKPFFFGWRPAKYPQDIHYAWRDGDVIRPDNSGPRDLMSFSINARAYDG